MVDNRREIPKIKNRMTKQSVCIYLTSICLGDGLLKGDSEEIE